MNEMDGICFLILGIANGGVFLSRQLRRQWPDSTIYAVGTPDAIGQYSNTINGFYPASSEAGIMACINEVIRVANGKRVKAFMCSNPILEYIVLHHPELFDVLEFENDVNLYRRIVDKTRVDKLCRSLKMARPDEYRLNDFSDASTCFPVVVKPLEKMSTIGASKCAYLNSPEELRSYMEKMSRKQIDIKDLICQQFVKGDNRWEYGYGGYFKDGKPLIDVFFHQFIQIPQGLCCYSREMTDFSLQSRIQETVKPFLEKTRYNGFLEFDIKQDQDSNVLYVLDVNPRPWRSVDMLSVKLGSSTVFFPTISNEKVVWRYPYRELFHRKNKKNVSYKLCNSLAPGRFVTKLALYDKTDILPYHQQRANDIKELFRLIKTKIHR